MPEFNLFVIGDGEVGKSTFIKMYDGWFHPKYKQTLGFELHPMVFNTTRGEIKFNVYDTVGQAEILDHADYCEADCAIVMFDVTRSGTFFNVQRWSADVICASGKEDLPVLIVGNKCDLKDEREVFQDRIEHMEVSAMFSGYKYVAPFEHLARILLGDDELTIVEAQPSSSSPPPSPLVPADETFLRLLETDEDFAKAYAEAAAASLPTLCDDEEDL